LDLAKEKGNMRIAQVAPLIESVPPKHYGGTERIVSYLTEELVRSGHDVTLFGSGDSVTGARLIAPIRRSLRKNERCRDPVARELILIDHVVEHASEFDIIHFHTGYPHFAICRYLPVPHVTTLHGRLDLSDFVAVHERFQDVPLISISNAQRAPINSTNWQQRFTMDCRKICSAFILIAEITLLFWDGSRQKKERTVRPKLPNASECRSRSQPKSIGPIDAISNALSSRC
jgi:glycosyltransferase involved in cell wall biosynthesis